VLKRDGSSEIRSQIPVHDIPPSWHEPICSCSREYIEKHMPMEYNPSASQIFDDDETKETKDKRLNKPAKKRGMPLLSYEHTFSKIIHVALVQR
jgi:hypothetical protein